MSDNWSTLLVWLESFKGFARNVNSLAVELRDSTDAGGGRKLVATRDIYPRECLVKLPSKSLLNLATLVPLYPVSIRDNLTANQLLPLHIALYRHQAYGHQSSSSTHETFTAYIQTLPQDFSTVPLWREKTGCKIWQRLEKPDSGLLPEGLRAKTEDVSKRFTSDWEKVQHVWKAASLESLPGLDDFGSLTLENFVWAWLCVNSRCIWHDLALPLREDNITLAPIIDMGNHLPGRKETMSDDSDGTFVLLSSTRQVSPFLPVIPAKQILIREGDEIFYTYGAHSDDTLLAEYGFVLGVPLNSHNNVDVTQRVEALFHRLDTAEREEKVDLLREHQYWGYYHLQLDSEGNADVSYRLTIALALLNLPKRPAKKQKIGSSDDPASETAYNPWLALVNGEVANISAENDAASRSSLVEICLDLEKDAVSALKGIQRDMPGDDLVKMLEKVWETELWFAHEVMRT